MVSPPPKFPALVESLIFAVGFPAFAVGAEVAHFRLTVRRSQRFEDAAKAKDTQDALVKLGRETKSETHDGHADLTYRCPDGVRCRRTRMSRRTAGRIG